jgi:hypothetical protein
MNKLTIAELRRLLPVGTEYTATYLGADQVIHGNLGPSIFEVDHKPYRRRVIANTSKMMRSLVIDTGSEPRCEWNQTLARWEDDGSIILSFPGSERGTYEDFMKIELTKEQP